MSAIGDGDFEPGFEPNSKGFEELIRQQRAEARERLLDEKNAAAERRAENLPPDQQDLAAALRGDNPVHSPASPHE